MSLPNRVIMQGQVATLDVKEGKTARDGTPYRIVTAVIFGPQTYGAVTLSDEMGRIVVGSQVTLQCDVGVFRDDDQLRAVNWLDKPKS